MIFVNPKKCPEDAAKVPIEAGGLQCLTLQITSISVLKARLLNFEEMETPSETVFLLVEAIFGSLY